MEERIIMIEILSWILLIANMLFKICVIIEISFCLHKISRGLRSDQNVVVIYSLLGILMGVIYLAFK